MALPIFMLFALPAGAQSIDQIVAAAAQREAAHACTPASEGELVVCGDRDAGARYRLPLRIAHSPMETGAVAGEVPAPSAHDPFLSGCGPFRGQRRCAKAEAAAYGYGGGRDPVTAVGRLLTKLTDPGAEIGPAWTPSDQPR